MALETEIPPGTLATAVADSFSMFVAASVILAAVALASGDPVHYPPASTNINNLTFVLNGSGAPGIFTSSNTPDSEYGIYNWCNMPHVRQREYKYAESLNLDLSSFSLHILRR